MRNNKEIIFSSSCAKEAIDRSSAYEFFSGEPMEEKFNRFYTRVKTSTLPLDVSINIGTEIERA